MATKACTNEECHDGMVVVNDDVVSCPTCGGDGFLYEDE